jgi:hypothetical protein
MANVLKRDKTPNDDGLACGELLSDCSCSAGCVEQSGTESTSQCFAL